MVYGCGAKTVKLLVFFFNFLAFLSGAIIFIACIASYFSSAIQGYLVNELDKIPDVSLGELSSIKGVLIVGMIVGGIIFLCGFAGCCGALSESTCLLTMFAITMVLMLLVQVILGIIAIAFKGKMHDWSNEVMNKTAADAGKSTTGPGCNFFKDMANQSHCCWLEGEAPTQGNCTFNCGQKIHGIGCNDYLWDTLWKNIKIAGIVLLVLIVLEIAATTFACCLCNSIRHGDHLYETV